MMTRGGHGPLETASNPLDQTFVAAAREARELLAKLRGTPMRRGGGRRQRLAEVSENLAAPDIPELLARRMALQAVLKCDDSELGRALTWVAVGSLLRHEVTQLRTRLGLRDRQVAALLPKLSPHRAEVFFEELSAADCRIARTILNAATSAADPVQTGRRYLAGIVRAIG